MSTHEELLNIGFKTFKQTKEKVVCFYSFDKGTHGKKMFVHIENTNEITAFVVDGSIEHLGFESYVAFDGILTIADVITLIRLVTGIHINS
jgi:hypothetical protein